MCWELTLNSNHNMANTFPGPYNFLAEDKENSGFQEILYVIKCPSGCSRKLRGSGVKAGRVPS